MNINGLPRSRQLVTGLFTLFDVARDGGRHGQCGITYQGRIIKPDGTPLEAASTQFKIQIRTPNTSDCLMYEETRVVDMTGSAGVFAITINDGGGTRTDISGYTLPQVFGNHGTFTFAAGTCGGANTYAPNPTDGRKLSVSFNDGSAWEMMPNVAVNFAPAALEAVQVGGFPSDTLLRVQDASGVPASTSALTPANFTELLALLNGTSTHYVGSAGAGAVLPNLSSNSPTAAGDIWFDSTSHQVKFYDGTTTQIVGTSGGSVTSIAAGTGLTGGPITSSGTLSLAAIGSGGTGATKINYDTYGRVTGSSGLVGDDITSGTIGGSTSMNTTGNVTAANFSGNNGAFKTLEIWKSDNSNKITLSAPAGLATNYGLSLPTTAGTASQVLTSDGSGGLSWTTPTSGTVTGVTGSLPVVVTGTSAPVVSVNAATTSASGVVQLATDGQSAASVVVQGNDSRLSNSRAPSGVAGGDLAGTYPSPTIATGAVTTPKLFTNPGVNRLVATDATTGATLAPLSCSSGQLLTWNVLSGWTCTSQSALSANGVVNVTAGSGLTGGTITSSGTLAVDTGTTAGKIVALDGLAKLPAVDGSALTNLNASALASGTLPSGRLPAFTGDVTSIAGTSALTLGTVPSAKGGTGLTSIGTANQVLGVNAGATGLEYKTLTAGTGVTLSNTAGAVTISAAGTGGTVTSVTSANTDIGVATTTSTPVLTLNSGTGANQILKLNASSQIPAVDGSLLTNLNPANLSAVVPVAKGGTGLSAVPTNGQLLIGNGTGYAQATITAGAGVSVTNAAGGITIAATGSGGTVTSVTGTLPVSVATGTSTPVISIAKSTTSVDGYLAAADFTLFNNKLGTTSIFAGDVSGTSAAMSVDKIKGTPLSITSITSGNFLKYDGTNWINSNIAASDIASGTLAAARLPAFTGDVTSTAGTSALTLGTVPVAKGGTGLTAGGTANQVLGMNAGATGLEYKTITAGTGVTLSNTAGAVTINATGSGGTVTSVGVAVPSYMTTSGGPITSSGSITLGFGSQTAKTIFAAPQGAAGAPTFRAMNIADIQSSVSGSFLTASGACAAGSALSYSSVSDTISCQAETLTSSQVTTALGGTPVLNAGGAVSLQQGLFASMPTAGTAGREYLATDSKKIYRDNGTSWDLVASTVASDLTGTLATAQLPVVPVAKGGTGLTTAPTNGQLLIGNGTGYAQATITAGTGVSISNSAGGITINATGSGGTVTGVTGTAPITVTGTTAPVVSLAKSTTSVDGYLAATDFTIFNNKLGTASAFTGDVSGTSTTTSVDKLKGTPISITTIASGNFLKYDGTNWMNATPASTDLSDGATFFKNGGNAFGTAASLGTNDANSLSLKTGGTARLIVDATGKVGVGTSTPGAMLDVKPSLVSASGTDYGVKIQPSVNASGTAGYTALLVNSTETATGSGSKLLMDLQVGGTSKARIDSGGNIIGNYLTTNGANIAGNVFTTGQFSETSATTATTPALSLGNESNTGIFSAYQSHVIGFTSAGSEKMRIDAGGNVGIGSTSPAYTLDVNGSARATQLCIGTDCRSTWPTSSSGGTVTSISAGTGLTGGPITATGTLAVDVGTTANKIVQLDAGAKLPAVDASALTNLNASTLASGTIPAARMPAHTGDVTTTAGSVATTVAALQTIPLTITSLTSGNYLRYNGSAWVNALPSSADLSDAGTLIKSSQMPANCAANQTLTFSSPTGTWVCSAITVDGTAFTSQTAKTFLAAPSGSAGTPSFRTIASADLPSIASGLTGVLPVANGGTGSSAGNITGTGALSFSAGGTAQNINLYPTNEGNVTVGYAFPTASFYVRSGTPGVASGSVTVSGTAGSTAMTLSASTMTINIGDYIVPSASTAQARYITVSSGTNLTIEPGQPLTANVSAETFTIYRPITAMMNGSTPKLLLQGYTGRLGIGTRYPTAAVDANTGIANQNNTGVRGVITLTHTASGNYTDMGTQFTAIEKIAAGVNDTGSQLGGQYSFLRNYGLTGDSGTLANQYAISLSYGHLNTDAAATPTTTSVYGLYLQPYTMTGTIGNMYDMYIASTASGGTVSGTHYGMYQVDGNNPNYFGSRVGVGMTPSYPLDVSGDIRTSTCIRTSAGVSAGTCSSDERLKTNVHAFDLGLDVLLGVQPKLFKYNGLGGQPASENDELGVIAQDVEKIAPSLVHSQAVTLHPGDPNKTEIKTVNYSAFLYVVINSIKQFYAEFSESKRAIASLQEENARLKDQATSAARERDEMRARLDRIEQKLNSK